MFTDTEVIITGFATDGFNVFNNNYFFLYYDLLQVDTISKELLLMGEVNQQQKEQIKKLSLSENQIPEEASIQLHSISEELSLVQQIVRKQKAEIDAQALKLSDSEVLLSTKDMEIKELKKFTENVKGTYIAKLKVIIRLC